tara:strand:- start:2381 stop:2788 length:408 start_codon:yes stop_codon:yes gene_type:complete
MYFAICIIKQLSKMKELNNFREYLNEAKFKVGDKVTMNNGGPEMEITKTRRMFGSDLNAYSVKKADGEEMEYDEKQLRLAENDKNDYANSEEDYTDSMVMEKIIDIIKYHELDPSDVLEEVGQEFGINFEFGRGQ